MTEQEFKDLVAQKTKNGMSFVLAVYEAMEEARVLEESLHFACHKGCGLCCNQLIVATNIEIAEIASYFQTMPSSQRTRVLYVANKRADDFKRWMKKFNPRDPRLSNQLWMAQQWLGNPCPFLGHDRACAIYPVRPIDCRTYHSVSICTNLDQSHIEHMPFDCELWANNMILEEQKRCYGHMGVIVLLWWLLEYGRSK